MKDLVLVADVGTQRMKVSLIDASGSILEGAVEEYDPPYFSPKAGWAEKDAESYWKTFLNLARNVVADFKERIAAIAVTTQRDSLVLIDENAKALRPVILWLDHRLADFDLKLPFFETLIYKAAGMWRTIKNVYRQAKINWVRQNEPEIWAKTFKVVQLSGFFIARLSGKFVDSVASQIGHIPFDYKRRRWCSKRDIKSKLFPIPDEKLPDLVEPGVVIGNLTKKAKEELGFDAKVIAAGSDKGCETLGLCVVNEDEISLSLSTTATIQTTTRKYFETLPHLPPYPGMIKGTYNPEVEIFRGFWLVRWFRDEFAHFEKSLSEQKGIPAEKLLDDLLKDSEPGSLGLVTQPFWTPGLDNPEARGAIIGFSSFHKREHVYRSIIEGLFFALREGMERIKKKGKLSFKVAKVAGGGSRSGQVLRIAASVLKLPVYRDKRGEAASLGAAMAAFSGLGFYKDLKSASKTMCSLEGPFEPNPKDMEIYDFLYEHAYKRIYPHLKSIYKSFHSHFEEVED